MGPKVAAMIDFVGSGGKLGHHHQPAECDPGAARRNGHTRRARLNVRRRQATRQPRGPGLRGNQERHLRLRPASRRALQRERDRQRACASRARPCAKRYTSCSARAISTSRRDPGGTCVRSTSPSSRICTTCAPCSSSRPRSGCAPPSAIPEIAELRQACGSCRRPSACAIRGKSRSSTSGFTRRSSGRRTTARCRTSIATSPSASASFAGWTSPSPSASGIRTRSTPRSCGRCSRAGTAKPSCCSPRTSHRARRRCAVSRCTSCTTRERPSSGAPVDTLSGQGLASTSLAAQVVDRIRTMPPTTPTESLSVDGHEVIVTNPRKILFPQAGHTKLDVVRYFLHVAAGALRGSGGRPNILVRYPNGIDGEFFYQKRAPKERPPWVGAVTIRFPSGRSADEIVPKQAADLAWMANLACLELHPHPRSRERPRSSGRAAHRPRPGPRRALVAGAGSRRGRGGDARGVRPARLAQDLGQARPARARADRDALDALRGPPCRARPRPRRRAPGAGLATTKWWKEERHGVFIDYNQNAKDRTVAGAYSVRPVSDARVSAPLAWERSRRRDPADFTLATMPARFDEIGDPHAGIDERAYSLDSLLELSTRHEREGQGDAPWPPQYAKAPGEPTRAPPSRRARSKSPGKGS